jgi:hypothetical protein
MVLKLYFTKEQITGYKSIELSPQMKGIFSDRFDRKTDTRNAFRERGLSNGLISMQDTIFG